MRSLSLSSYLSLTIILSLTLTSEWWVYSCLYLNILVQAKVLMLFQWRICPWILSKSGKRACNHIFIIYDITLRYRNKYINRPNDTRRSTSLFLKKRHISPWETALNAIYSLCLGDLIKQKWKIHPRKSVIRIL